MPVSDRSDLLGISDLPGGLVVVPERQKLRGWFKFGCETLSVSRRSGALTDKLFRIV